MYRVAGYRRCVWILLAVGLAFSSRLAAAENWPEWRGPRGNSTSAETSLPVEWSDTSGIAWKTPLPEWGTSTPAIWNDAVFVTTQHDEDLLVLKLDRHSGAIEWTQKVGQAATQRQGPPRAKQKFHRLHNLASPSPVTDGKLVVVHFGNGDLAAYDFAGKLRWKHNLQDRSRHVHDLVGARQQPRAVQRHRHLGVHAGFAGRCARRAGAELPGGPRPGDRPGALEVDAADRRPVRTGRRLHHADPRAHRRHDATGRDGRQPARRLRSEHREAALVSAGVWSAGAPSPAPPRPRG